MTITANLSRHANFSQHGLAFFAGKVAIGSTGAVGAQTGKGFAVTRTGAGLYTVTLTGTGGCVAIPFAEVHVVFATGGNTQTATILSQDAPNRKITIQCNDAGTVDVAADPPSGAFLSFLIIASILDA
jgi:hypothetical protein